jgi:ABC-type branched-subunit amino acid transport system permease subunit
MTDFPQPPKEPNVPAPPDAGDRPRVGVDEWVTSVEGRRSARAPLVRAYERVPKPVQGLVALAVAAALPFVMNSGNLFDYGLFTLLYALLGLGLNVVVGFAGLLDLGYIAFYGIGAYSYAELASPKYGLHWQAEVAIPVIMVGTALVGLVLGVTSRRLLGDYLAIVTLFFGQAFVVFANNANPHGITGGANGIAPIDPISLFGYKLTSTKGYYYFLVIVVIVVVAALASLLRSRTGRAWKALREDPLAAEMMGTPVNRLKIVAFAFGAGIAGLAGAIFAAVSTGIASGAFDTSLLITIYAVVILGGTGSIAGVIVGAIVINVSYEALSPSTPSLGRWLFYLTILGGLIAIVRPWRRLVVVLAGTAAFGFAAHAIAGAISSTATSGTVTSGGRLTSLIHHWVIIPAHPGKSASYAYVVLILAVITLTRLSGWWRTFTFIPVLYLVTFVWENLLVEQPAVTRLIIFGALLIVIMQIRPQGLLGTSRVEIV